MCRATEALIDLGIEKRTDLSTIDLICKKIRKGKTVETIADEIEKEVDEVKPIFNVAWKFAPDYDVKAIYDALKGNK